MISGGKQHISSCSPHKPPTLNCHLWNTAESFCIVQWAGFTPSTEWHTSLLLTTWVIYNHYCLALGDSLHRHGFGSDIDVIPLFVKPRWQGGYEQDVCSLYELIWKREEASRTVFWNPEKGRGKDFISSLVKFHKLNSCAYSWIVLKCVYFSIQNWWYLSRTRHPGAKPLNTNPSLFWNDASASFFSQFFQLVRSKMCCFIQR